MGVVIRAAGQRTALETVRSRAQSQRLDRLACPSCRGLRAERSAACLTAPSSRSFTGPIPSDAATRWKSSCSHRVDRKPSREGGLSTGSGPRSPSSQNRPMKTSRQRGRLRADCNGVLGWAARPASGVLSTNYSRRSPGTQELPLEATVFPERSTVLLGRQGVTAGLCLYAWGRFKKTGWL